MANVTALAVVDRGNLVIKEIFSVAWDTKGLFNSYRLFELLPMTPRFTIDRICQLLDATFPTATAAVKTLEDLGIVVEMTGQKKNRNYSYRAYIELLSR